MRLLQEIMSSYFNDEEKVRNPLREAAITLTVNTPIKPKQFTWERMTDPERLGKTFEFKGHEEYKSFVSELMQYEAETGHYGKVVCEYPKVHVEVYTHDVNGITELDLEYAAEMDDIRRDVAYYVEENNNE